MAKGILYNKDKVFDKLLISAIIEPLKIFNWSNADELYINVGVSVNTGKFISGDEKGRIWIYQVLNYTLFIFNVMMLYVTQYPIL